MDARLDHQANQRALRDLVCGLSRELREPLISLRDGFDLLLNDVPRPIPPERQGHVATIAGLCDELLGLTRGYLDYAEAARPSGPSRPRPLSLGAIVAELDRKFGPKARRRGLTLEIQADPADAQVTADMDRCAPIFDNLISNAIAYAPPGRRARVEARLDGDSWLLSVDDDGPGIPAEFQERIFEPFYRLDRDEHSTTPGQGLGLAICRELAAQLGGEVRVWSEVDRGARFTVVLPREPRAAD